MSAVRSIPEVDDAQTLLEWALSNPDAVTRAVQLLNMLGRLSVRLTAPTTSRPTDEYSAEDGGENVVILLPLKLTTPINTLSTLSITAGASYSQTQQQQLIDAVKAQTTAINTLLAELRKTGMLPS